MTTQFVPQWEPDARVYAVQGERAHTIARRGTATRMPLTACGLVVDQWWQGEDLFADQLTDCQRCATATRKDTP